MIKDKYEKIEWFMGKKEFGPDIRNTKDSKQLRKFYEDKGASKEFLRFIGLNGNS